eukprot:TRINITY_DN30442_c1_g1_i1.p1 TRINITY_DN30442_c1_g1~~TRINITY_DN30442_c1_g1_i1.p1  ORF type:complete len:366 (+),score=33.00 TRINITY_DN30442_c1_g1_i1:188-1285(+)
MVLLPSYPSPTFTTPTPTPTLAPQSFTVKHLHQQSEPHQVLNLIADRHQTRSKPLQRKDGYKIGLCVEGGGMRGVVSGAMLMQLLPYRDCFDVVYGSSAGAINSTYFLTGETHGLSVYIDDISNTQFVDLRRLFSDDPVLDLDFLLEYVMHEKKPLNWEGVIQSPIPLKVVASCLDRLGPCILNEPKTKQELLNCLRASAQVPMIAGDQPITVQGRRCVDAAVFEPIPYLSAVLDGCTHVMVLCTRPPPENEVGISAMMTNILSHAVKKIILNSDFMDAAWEAAYEWEQSIGDSNESLLLRSFQRSLGEGDLHNLLNSVDVLPVYPTPENTSFSPTCIDVEQLNKGLFDGKTSMRQVLNTHPYLS